MADYTEALATLNQVKSTLASSARSVAKALDDGKISPMEGLSLGMAGINLASTVMFTLQRLDKDSIQDFLYVLEHGEWVLP